MKSETTIRVGVVGLGQRGRVGLTAAARVIDQEKRQAGIVEKFGRVDLPAVHNVVFAA